MSRWTNEELEYLINNSKQKTINELATELNRTDNSVFKKIYLLKLDYVKVNETGKLSVFDLGKWSDDEIEILKQYYKTRTNSFLSKKLNRSSKTISKKIKELNLTGERINQDHLHWDNEEIEFIKLNWKKLSDDELADYINKNLNPIKNRNSRSIANLRKKILRLIRPNKLVGTKITWTDKDEEFLINNFYNMTIEEISSCLGKSQSSILNRSRSLGLKLLSSKGVVWDTDTINYLKEKIDKLSINEITRNLQIPVEKIIAKSIELNLIYQVKQLTNPEIFVKNQLEKLNIDFNYQVNVSYKYENYTTKTYRVDFLIDNIVIEVQGDYYHCNPDVYKDGPIDAIQINNTTRDKLKKRHLEELGYKVYYIWENDIENKPQEIIKQIAALFSNK